MNESKDRPSLGEMALVIFVSLMAALAMYMRNS